MATWHGIEVSDEDVRVLSNFFDDQGRLHTIPTKRAKRLVLLDFLSQHFELGRTYPEKEVDVVINRFHPDHAALRRYLVEEQFLTREAGVYWRTGGTVHV